MGCGNSSYDGGGEGPSLLLNGDPEEVDMSAETLAERGWGGPTTLPRNLWRTHSIKRLNISGQNLSSCDKITQLPNLEELNISDNEIQELPYGISKLTKLRVLIAFKNQLSLLPKSIGKLSELTQINCYNNKLEKVPSEINLLTNLEQLNFGSNFMTSLPALHNLVKLNFIKCQMCKIKTIEGSWETLTAMEELVFNTNQLETLPKMPISIREIDVVGNKLESVDEALEGCVNLQELKANSNKLCQFPLAALRSPLLTTLCIASNIRITSIPDDIGLCKNLQTLVVGGNSISTLPSSLGDLPKLRRLQLSGNALRLETDSTAGKDETTAAVYEKLKAQCLETNPETGKPHGYFR